MGRPAAYAARTEGNISTPELEFILAVQYEESPVREFTNGFRQAYKLNGHVKAKGLRLDMQLPRSWKGEEGNRPNVVHKWTSANGTGMEIMMLLVKMLGSERVSKADVAESLRGGEIRDMVPEGGRFINARAITIEAQPGYLLEFDMVHERAGRQIAVRTAMYSIFFDAHVISFQCMSGEGGADVEKVAASFARMKPLCQQVANSIVLPQRY